MVPNRTSEPQCLQELRSFLNTVTGPCVLDCSSGGFPRGFFFFKEYERKKVTPLLSFRLTDLTVFDAASTVSGQSSSLLFLERRWLFSYLEVLGRLSCPS